MPSVLKTPLHQSFAIPTLVRVDPLRTGLDQPNLHTRWHPDIPTVATVELGKPFKVQCLDWSGGQIINDDCADDVLHLDHNRDHSLSGPFHVPGAEPGDAIAVDVLEIQPHDDAPWGYSFIQPGLGPLDHPMLPSVETVKSIFDFEGVQISSRHIPHVHFDARPHPGCIGTAPSAELLAEWTRRESALCARHMNHGVEVASLPNPDGAYVGQDLPAELRERIYREGARTSPGREHGGNIDIGSLTKGSRVYLPVFVPGANLSVGDLHFNEGDGEPTTAIEMAGIITLRVTLIKKGVEKFSLRTPMYVTSPSEPKYPRQVVFTGISTDENGEQKDMDGTLAYQNAAWSAMNYLEKFGYTREQAYLLLSTAPIESRVVATANRPNMVVSIGLPIDIFEFNIDPSANTEGIVKREISGPAVLSAAGRALERSGAGH